MKFKPGDHVRMKVDGIWYYGEVTIVTPNGTSKVLFLQEDAPDYWYYNENDLELVKPEDVKDE